MRQHAPAQEAAHRRGATTVAFTLAQTADVESTVVVCEAVTT
jgi:3,4-dihydroxy-2-butanone 4-phosphate synthase